MGPRDMNNSTRSWELERFGAYFRMKLTELDVGWAKGENQKLSLSFSAEPLVTTGAVMLGLGRISSRREARALFWGYSAWHAYQMPKKKCRIVHEYTNLELKRGVGTAEWGWAGEWCLNEWVCMSSFGEWDSKEEKCTFVHPWAQGQT